MPLEDLELKRHVEGLLRARWSRC